MATLSDVPSVNTACCARKMVELIGHAKNTVGSEGHHQSD
jgi:hypothetical protein